eukprot:9173050-Alexandrium_andersonii.AAC.1
MRGVPTICRNGRRRLPPLWQATGAAGHSKQQADGRGHPARRPSPSFVGGTVCVFEPPLDAWAECCDLCCVRDARHGEDVPLFGAGCR